jgi:hypothetical protein
MKAAKKTVKYPLSSNEMSTVDMYFLDLSEYFLFVFLKECHCLDILTLLPSQINILQNSLEFRMVFFLIRKSEE